MNRNPGGFARFPDGQEVVRETAVLWMGDCHGHVSSAEQDTTGQQDRLNSRHPVYLGRPDVQNRNVRCHAAGKRCGVSTLDLSCLR